MTTSSIATYALLQSLVGGITIPIAAHALLLLNGNIFGISGFVHGAVQGHVQDVVSLSGLILGGVVASRLEGKGSSPLSIESLPLFLLSGFLVGLGSKLANGCTSGHMICGISRLSVRSIAATTTFFVTGVITARIMHENLQSATIVDWTLGTRGIKLLALQAIPLFLNLLIYALASINKPTVKSVSEPNSVNPPNSHLLRIFVRLSTSFQFALALHLSNLNDARRVRSFLLLPFHRAFDPSLAFVAAGALPVGLFLYHFARGDGCARLGGTTIVKTGEIDARLLVGSAIFGIGWGMSGICPGPGLVNFGLSLSSADLREIAPFARWLGCMALGGLLV